MTKSSSSKTHENEGADHSFYHIETFFQKTKRDLELPTSFST